MTLLLEILNPLLLFPLAGPLLRIIVRYIGCGAWQWDSMLAGRLLKFCQRGMSQARQNPS